MNKQKIFVRNVLPCASDLDVAIIKMNDRELQICLPKYCNIAKYIGEEVYYEVVGYVNETIPIMPDADNKKVQDKEFIKQ